MLTKRDNLSLEVNAMKKRVKLTMVLLPLLLGSLLTWSVLTVMAKRQGVPLKGKFAGAGDYFSGQITHLGQFDGVFDPTTCSAVLIAANGDSMIAQFDRQPCPQSFEDLGPQEEMDITGGSGQFSFADGSAFVSIKKNSGGEIGYHGRIDGTLTWRVPDDTHLSARIAARQHLLDINDDGQDELFEYDVAVLEENNESSGSVQWRNGNVVTSLVIKSGISKCDREYNRPYIRLGSTATSYSAGNNDAVQEVQHMAINIIPIYPDSGFDSPLRWTIVTTDPGVLGATAAVGVNHDFDLFRTLNFTDTWPFDGFTSNPCLIIR